MPATGDLRNQQEESYEVWDGHQWVLVMSPRLQGYNEGYGAAMDDGWGEPKHIEKAVLAERERIVGIITEYYKVAPKAAEPLLRLIKGDVDEAHRT